jgi:hypothetical protein
MFSSGVELSAIHGDTCSCQTLVAAFVEYLRRRGGSTPE